MSDNPEVMGHNCLLLFFSSNLQIKVFLECNGIFNIKFLARSFLREAVDTNTYLLTFN